MRKLIKRLTIIAFIILLIPIAGLLFLKTSPHSFIELSQHFHDYDISAEAIDISLLNPTIDISDLVVSNQQGVQLLHTDKLSLSSQWKNLFFGNKNMGLATIKNSIIHIEPITQSLPPSDANKKEKEESPTNETLDIHKLLQIANISLSNIQLNATNNTQIHIVTFESFSADGNNQAGINFDLNYQQGDASIPIKGQLSSIAASSTASQLLLHINELDIRALTATAPDNSSKNESKKSSETNTTATTSSVNSTEPAPSAAVALDTVEQAIDWSPLQQFAPLDFTLTVDKVRLAQGEVSDLATHLRIKSTPNSTQKFIIEYKQSGQLALDINEDLHFSGPLTVNAQWQTLNGTTTGADIKGKTTIVLADNTAIFDGLINLNSFDAQNILVDISLTRFPFTAKSPSAKEMEQQSADFLPFTTSTQVQLDNKKLSLTDVSLKAGKSDLTGHISVAFNQTLTALAAIEFDLKSTQIFLPESTPADSNKPVQQEKTTRTAKADKLFNSDPIDSSFLETINTKGQLNIGKMYYGDRVLLEGLNSSLLLQDKTLSLNSQVDQLAQGKVDTDISIKQNNGQLQLSTKGSVDDLLLESLALLPKDEFTGGKTTINFSLSSQGNSTQALASGLQGDFLLSSSEGTIANNSFEIVGSDLLLNLINTINPFYKKAKNTQLECAVVKTNIKDGKMKFNNSIAIKTSKMTVIANGNINLAKERINLGINPKARAGAGVDIASLAKFIALKGSLSKPSIGVSAEGSLKSALQLGAAVSTGGLSLIASGIADKAISGDACKIAHKAFTN